MELHDLLTENGAILVHFMLALINIHSYLRLEPILTIGIRRTINHVIILVVVVVVFRRTTHNTS